MGGLAFAARHHQGLGCQHQAQSWIRRGCTSLIPGVDQNLLLAVGVEVDIFASRRSALQEVEGTGNTVAEESGKEESSSVPNDYAVLVAMEAVRGDVPANFPGHLARRPRRQAWRKNLTESHRRPRCGHGSSDQQRLLVLSVQTSMSNPTG